MVALTKPVRLSENGISENDLRELSHFHQKQAVESSQMEGPTCRKAGWSNTVEAFERREQLRSSAAFEVQLTPLSIDMEPAGQARIATLLNYSETGACLQHEQLLTEPFIRIEWNDQQAQVHTAIIKLKWCRSLAQNCHMTGGRVIRIN